MPLFWFLMGMLTMVAILCVLLPWLRTIPRFDSLPALPWQAPLVGLMIVGAALLLYRWIGRPELVQSALAPAPVNSVTNDQKAGSAAAGSMQSALTSLKARLAKGGGSNDDWELLAKTYDFMGQPQNAAAARRHELPADAAGATTQAAAAAPALVAPALTPESLKLIAKADRDRADKKYTAAAGIYAELAKSEQMNADTWADYADAVGSANGGKLAGAPENYIARALALDPKHPKALWLKASADEEAGRMGAAVSDWQALQAVLPPDSPDAKMVAANLKHDSAQQADALGASARGAGTEVSGEVSLASTLKSKVPPSGTLFIVAKSVDSPGAPVAVYRGSLGDWPVKFTLDDSQSMLPGRNLSSAGRVTVEARISQSGQAMPTSGDLLGKSGIINPTDHQPLKIIIDQVIS